MNSQDREVQAWEQCREEKAANFPFVSQQDRADYNLGQRQNRWEESLRDIESQNLDDVRQTLFKERVRRSKLDPPQTIEIPREFIVASDEQIAELGPPPKPKFSEAAQKIEQSRQRMLALRADREEIAQAIGSTALEEYVRDEETRGAKLADENAAQEREYRIQWANKCAMIIPRQRKYFITDRVRQCYEELCNHYDMSAD